MPHLTAQLPSPNKNTVSDEDSSPQVSHHNDLHIVKTLSKSNFTIYQAKDSETKKNYAMKVFPLGYKNRANVFYENEKRFSKLDHPNIVKMVTTLDRREAEVNNEKMDVSYIVYELYQFGSLNKICYSETYDPTETMGRTFFRQIVSAVEYLHNKDVAHLDIKPENLLLTDDYQVKLCDFDTAFHKGDYAIVSKGSKNYRAPELGDGKCTNPEAADVYSMGITLFALVAGNLPYNECQAMKGYNLQQMMFVNTDLFWNVHKEIQAGKFNFFSKEFRYLFEGMTQRNPAKRWTIKDIKASKWYNGEIYTDEQFIRRLSFVF